MIFLFSSQSTHGMDLDPQRIGSWPGFRRGGGQLAAVADNYAYLLSGGLHVIDVRHPSQPHRVWGYDPKGGVSSVAISGRFMYLIAETSMKIFDVSDPVQPQQVGEYATTNLNGTVTVKGNYAYVTGAVNLFGGEPRDRNGLNIIDISNPTQPRQVGGIPLTNGVPYILQATGQYIFVSESSWINGQSSRSWLQVIDLENPSNPRRIGSYTFTNSYLQMRASGQYAYLLETPSISLNPGRLHVIDISNPSNLQWISSQETPNNLSIQAVLGHYLLLTQGDTGLRIIDVSDPIRPQWIGTFKTTGWCTGLAVSGQNACLIDTAGLRVIDISNPLNPQLKGELAFDWIANNVEVVENLVYIDGELGLAVIDVSDPTHPKQLGKYHLDGDALDVALSGHFAYLADGLAGLQVIDIGNPFLPQRIGGLDTGAKATHVAVSGRYACLTERRWDTNGGWERGRFSVIDVSDPVHPTRLSALDTRDPVTGVAVSGRQAFLLESWWDENTGRRRGSRLSAIDLSDPVNLRIIGTYETGHGAAGIALAGSYACLSLSDDNIEKGRLEVIDIRDPAHLRKVGQYEANARLAGLTVSGQYVYVAGNSVDTITYNTLQDGLRIIDISNPANPTLVGSVKSKGYSKDVAVAGQYAFLADDDAGLQVIDVSNPVAPVQIARHYLNGNTVAVAASGQHVWVASADPGHMYGGLMGEGLVGIDIGRLANPQSLGRLISNGQVQSMAVSGQYACLGVTRAVAPNQSLAALDIVDISNLKQPQQVGSVKLSTAPQNVEIAGHYAYVAEQSGMVIIDISHPTLPQRRGKTRPVQPAGLAVAGSYAYLAENMENGTTLPGRLNVIDINNPDQPSIVSTYKTAEQTRDVSVSGHYAYMATDAGLQVIDVSDPANPQYVSSHLMQGFASGVAISGRHACLIGRDPYTFQGWGIRLDVIDVSNPAFPKRVGRVEWAGIPAGVDYNGVPSALAVSISGNYVYATDLSTGLQVIDISDPAYPRRVGGNSAIDALAVTVLGDQVFMAGKQGLTILHSFATLHLGLVIGREHGQIRLSLSGLSGQRVHVQRSLDFKDWEDWQTVTLGEPTAILPEDTAVTPLRFYRALQGF